MRLLYRAVHKYRTARAEFYGVCGIQTLFREFVYFQPHGTGKSLNKRTAARRASFVKHYRVDCAVFNFKTLDILSADIYYKVDFRVEVQRGFKVRDRFDNSEVGFYCTFYEVFTIARYCACADF